MFLHFIFYKFLFLKSLITKSIEIFDQRISNTNKNQNVSKYLFQKKISTTNVTIANELLNCIYYVNSKIIANEYFINFRNFEMINNKRIVN